MLILEALARSQAEQSNRTQKKTTRPDLVWVRDFLDDFALVAADPGPGWLQM
jgi:hypothetical protein